MSILPPSKTPQEDYLWMLVTKSGQEIKIPPAAVEAVRKKIIAREAIATTSATIPFSEVKNFYKTAEKMVTIPLLEEAARAFREPLITTLDDGTRAVKARWVKKQVTNDEWSRYYSKGSYRRLDDGDSGLVWIAFTLPAHQVDGTKHSYLTKDEIRKISQ